MSNSEISVSHCVADVTEGVVLSLGKIFETIWTPDRKEVMDYCQIFLLQDSHKRLDN